MTRLGTAVEVVDETFAQNDRHNRALVEALRRRVAEAARGGADRHRDRHVSRGKLLPRDRLERLLDPGSPLLEIGQLAANGMYGDEAPGAGVIAAIGLIAGRTCVIVVNDPTVKGGAYFPMTVKKHLRAQEIARENRLPCVYLVDSGGGNLPHQAEIFADREHFGRIFFNQAQMSAEGIPQIACVMGSCTAGGAYIPAMSDSNTFVGRHDLHPEQLRLRDTLERYLREYADVVAYHEAKWQIACGIDRQEIHEVGRLFRLPRPDHDRIATGLDALERIIDSDDYMAQAENTARSQSGRAGRAAEAVST